MITKADIEILDTTGLDEHVVLDDGRVVFGPAFMLEVCDQWDMLLSAGKAIVSTDNLSALKANIDGFRQAIVRMRDQNRADIEDRQNNYIKLEPGQIVVQAADAACLVDYWFGKPSPLGFDRIRITEAATRIRDTLNNDVEE